MNLFVLLGLWRQIVLSFLPYNITDIVKIMVIVVVVDHFCQIWITVFPAIIQEKHVKLVSADVFVVIARSVLLSEVYSRGRMLLVLILDMLGE